MALFLYPSPNYVIALVLAATLMVSPPTLAQPVAFSEKALVTIRFNQQRVYYDQQLFGAVSKAVAVKPTVTFDIIAYAPSTGNAATDTQWRQAASAHAQAVVATMQNIGVPLSRMHVSGQHMPGLKFDEVHVIAR